MRCLLLALALAALSGCNQDEILQKFSSPEDQALTIHWIDRLRDRDFDAIEKACDPSNQPADLRQRLETMAALLPSSDPTSVTLVGAQTFYTPESKLVNTTLEYNFDGRWFLVNVTTRESNDAKLIAGFGVTPQPASLEDQNRFTLRGKSTAHYLVLAGALAAAILTLYSLVACIRTKALRRKWVWVIFILFGVGKVAINWTTGSVGFVPVAVQLFSANAAAQFYSPWVVSASLPIGALTFLVYRSFRPAPRPPEANSAQQPTGAPGPD